MTIRTSSISGDWFNKIDWSVVVFNATNASVTFTNSRLQGLALHLHPVHRNSSDPATRQSTFDPKEGTAKVPALTTAIFVSEIE
jgi:hypothetical protein